MVTGHLAGVIRLPLWPDLISSFLGLRPRVNPNKKKRLLLTLNSINFLFIIYWN